MNIVEARNLKKYFYKQGLFSGKTDIIKAVDGVSFRIEKGRTFGLVGDSGCGKTTIARMTAGILLPDEGIITVNSGIDMVFQDPYGSLNPRMRIGDIVGESLLVRGYKRNDIIEETRKVLCMVKLTDTGVIGKYPHQFSGGERQRIAIARSLIRKPEVLVLDEPVSSLDVSVQAGVLNLLKDLQEELGLTYLFISHDLRVVKFMSDEIGVMKNGIIVETAGASEIYSVPRHEYTRHLLDSIPEI